MRLYSQTLPCCLSGLENCSLASSVALLHRLCLLLAAAVHNTALEPDSCTASVSVSDFADGLRSYLGRLFIAVYLQTLVVRKVI